MTRDLDALLAQLNPFPDPDAAVDPARQAALLGDILALPAPPGRRRRRPLVHRFAMAGATLAAATAAVFALLLAGGEQPGAPQRFAVLTALAQDLREPGRILHTLVRSQGTEEETWTLLDDTRYQRFRIGRGERYEEGALAPGTSVDYQRRTNTVTEFRYHPEDVPPGPTRVDELPVDRLAQGAADGRIPVEARVEIRGRRALKLRNGDGVWYVAEDAPVLLRHEFKLPSKRIVRTDFLTFEILPATPENRRLLEIHAPAGAEHRTIRAPKQP